VRTLQQRNSAPTATTTTSSAELGAYLAGLRVHVKLAAVEASDRAHVDRLLRTAAGFSLTGENANIEDAEVDRLFESRTCFLISVADRYSDYGPMGFVFVRTIDDTLLVDSMALSCVVLGKQVEFAVLSGLAQYAAERNLHRIAFEYNSSGRNQSIYGFLQSVSDIESQTRFSVLVSAVESRLKVAAVSPGTWTVRFEPTAERRGVLS
jgi:FkbH-like protein